MGQNSSADWGEEAGEQTPSAMDNELSRIADIQSKVYSHLLLMLKINVGYKSMTEFNGELPSRGGSRLQLHVGDTCNGMWGRRAPQLGFRGKAPVSDRVRADIFLYHFLTKLIHKFAKFR